MWTRWTNRMLIVYLDKNTKTVLYLEQRLAESRKTMSALLVMLSPEDAPDYVMKDLIDE